jgi:hypothetical protein
MDFRQCHQKEHSDANKAVYGEKGHIDTGKIMRLDDIVFADQEQGDEDHSVKIDRFQVGGHTYAAKADKGQDV